MSKKDLIPQASNWILSASDVDDGDIFPLGEGRTAEYDGEEQDFIVRQNGKVLGRVPHRKSRRR